MHDATASVRSWWSDDDGDGCADRFGYEKRDRGYGASITAFDIIIAGGDLGASRLIDYNAPHIHIVAPIENRREVHSAMLRVDCSARRLTGIG